MHLACNDHGWFGVTQDKLLFHAAALGAGLPVPELLAVVHPTRSLPGVPGLRNAEATASVLRDPGAYPFFAKPIDGIYSLGAVSAERQDAAGRVHLVGGDNRPLTDLAGELVGTESGMLIQRRLAPDAEPHGGSATGSGRFGCLFCSRRTDRGSRARSAKSRRLGASPTTSGERAT